jgi:hypothetical protein
MGFPLQCSCFVVGVGKARELELENLVFSEYFLFFLLDSPQGR